jgi:hypothetical protein
MYEDEEDPSAVDSPDAPSAAPPGMGGALSSLAAPEGLFPKADADLIPMPTDPTNPGIKWRQFAGNVLKGHTLAQGLSGATTAYADQEQKDAEMRMRYIPLANQARLQRSAQQLARSRQEQQMLETWNKTLIGNAASLLNRPGPINPQELEGMIGSAVQRGQVPAQLAQNFMKGLPQDPVALRAYLERAAISMVDPFRGVAKPEFKVVPQGGTLAQTNPAEGGIKEVIQGKPKPSELAVAIQEATALPAGDPRKKEYEQLINKLITHNPNQVTMINPPKPLINELMGGLGTAITAARGNAEASVGTLNTISRLRDALDSGKVIAGPGTTARVWLAQLGQVMGYQGKSRDEMLVNTRNAIQSMAQLEVDAAQAMKGQGALSDSERALIRRASAGDVDTMTVPELRLLANVLERTANYKIGRFRSSLDRIRTIKHEGQPIGKDVADLLDITVPDAASRKRIEYDAAGNPLPEKP